MKIRSADLEMLNVDRGGETDRRIFLSLPFVRTKNKSTHSVHLRYEDALCVCTEVVVWAQQMQ
jgi:hypothetical protein